MQHGPTLSRRRVLALTGGASAGGIAYLTTHTNQAAAAEVSLDGFSLEASEHTVGTVEAVSMRIPIEYSYSSPIDVATVRLDALAGDSLSNLEAYDSVDIGVETNEGDGSHTFDIDLLSSWHFSTVEFEPSGDSSDVLVAAGVRMALLDSDETVLTETTDDDAQHITVHSDGSLEVSYNATGTVTIT